jgi:STE24 endopeptidase
LYSPLSFVMGIFMNMVSRRNEYQADNYASQFGFADQLASGLKKLSVKNLSNLTPHPLYVFFNYSHPTLLQRLAKLEN